MAALHMLLAALLVPFSIAATQSENSSYYGMVMSFTPVQKNPDGTFKVIFHYRENGRGSCGPEPSWVCDSGDCGSVDSSKINQTDQDTSGRGLWCQSEGHFTRNSNDKPYTISYAGCCWGSSDGEKRNWTVHTKVDLGTRSDTHTFNKPPVSTTVPNIRVPQNCFSSLPLLAHDPDGDHVTCRFTADARKSCQSCHTHTNVTLDQSKCTLHATGVLAVGLHVFEMVLEDRPSSDVNLSYVDGTSTVRKAFNQSEVINTEPLSQVPLQFVLEILPALPNCEPGHVLPLYLTKSPTHGDILKATLGHPFQLNVRAKSAHATIFDFQVSGPVNMTKTFQNEGFGVSAINLTWTPQPNDLHRHIPLCFTAETNNSQSVMRCVVMTVARSLHMEDASDVSCTASRMTIVIKKNSLQGVDKSWLQLADPSCSLTANETHIMAIMSLSSCGTKLEDAGDFLVFKNEINSFEKVNAVISRRRQVKIGFSCRFPKTLSVSSHYQLHKSDYIFTESSFGSFEYNFDIFRDSNFSQKVEASAYPVEVNLLDTIYMGIKAKTDLPTVRLHVESCKATPTEDSKNSLVYYIIQNGCLKDETVKVQSTDPTKYNFEIQAFKFTGNYDQLYITCSVILCEEGNPNSRCAQGCLKNPSRRRRRSVNSETARHDITQGPLRVVRHAQRSENDEEELVAGIAARPEKGRATADKSGTHAEDGGDKFERGEGTAETGMAEKGTADTGGAKIALSSSMTVSTMVLAGLFIAIIVLLVVAIFYWTKRTKAGDHQSLLRQDRS